MKLLLPLAAFLLLAGCAASPADEKLEDAVRTRIRAHTALVSDNLRVHSENGVVYVSGLVSTYVEQVELDQLLKSTPGVIKFVDMTTIDNTRF